MEEEVLEKTGFVFEIYHVEWKHSQHSHDHYELFYQLNGVSSQKIDNCVYNVDKGDFILIPPNVVHETNVNGTLPARLTRVSSLLWITSSVSSRAGLSISLPRQTRLWVRA